jgi:trehalose 6-phosphate phosphatase
MRPEELVAALRADLPHALIALDFDGTLAPIVPDPADSRPAPGAVSALRALAEAGAQIAVITGRDAETVVDLGGLDGIPGVRVAGLYGVEAWHRGRLSTVATPAAIERLREQLPEVLRSHGADPAVWIEDKRLSLVVHGRRASDPDAALASVAGPVAELAGRLALEVHAGRGVLELRLPGFDKGGALRALVEELSPRAVLFAGDDVGDLPAFAAVRALRADGLAAWGVAAASAEVPEVRQAADLCVDGAPGVVALLNAVAGREV